MSTIVELRAESQEPGPVTHTGKPIDILEAFDLYEKFHEGPVDWEWEMERLCHFHTAGEILGHKSQDYDYEFSFEVVAAEAYLDHTDVENPTRSRAEILANAKKHGFKSKLELNNYGNSYQFCERS